MEELPTVRMIENTGLEGCAHARPNGKRQVLLVDIETLREMDLSPGIIRENITTEGLDVNGLALGQKLKVGEVELVVRVLVCEPCEQIEALRAGIDGRDGGQARNAVSSDQRGNGKGRG